jgi:hypothetical protein
MRNFGNHILLNDEAIFKIETALPDTVRNEISNCTLRERCDSNMNMLEDMFLVSFSQFSKIFNF